MAAAGLEWVSTCYLFDNAFNESGRLFCASLRLTPPQGSVREATLFTYLG